MQCILKVTEESPDLLWHPFLRRDNEPDDQCCMALFFNEDELGIILSGLATRDLLSIRETCKQWHRLASVLVKHLDISLKFIRLPELTKLSYSLSAAFSSVRTLVLSNIAKGTNFSSLSEIVQAGFPLLRSLHRLALLDVPVFELSPMRKLQLIQQWESIQGVQRVSEIDFLAQTNLPWEGCRWFFHYLSTLTGLRSLEIKLVPAKRAMNPSATSYNMDKSEEEEEEEEEEDVIERLILGQAAMIGSLASLSSLSSLRLLSLRLIDSIDHEALKEVQIQYGLGDGNDPVGGWDSDEERMSEEESNTSSDEDVEAAYHEGIEIEHEPLDHDPSRLPSFLLSLSATMLHLPFLTSFSIQDAALSPRDFSLLVTVLPSLLSLSVTSSIIYLSHKGIQAIGSLAFLESLKLSNVRLVFQKGDTDDCPERMMTNLYALLGKIPSFKILMFELDQRDRMHFMHSAYLIGLCEDGAIEETLASRVNEDKHDVELQTSFFSTSSFRHKIQDLSLSLVILDSDYTLMILGSLTNLTSLKMEYQAWPLSLARNDLSLLSSLSSLTSLKLSHVADSSIDSSDDILLALTSQSFNAIITSMTGLHTFHYSGPIIFDPSLAFDISIKTNLVDLSLTQSLPNLLRLPRLPYTLPKSLVSLSLTRVELKSTHLAFLGRHLSLLQSLSLADFDFSYQSFLSLATDDSFKARLSLLALSSTLSTQSQLSSPSRYCQLPYLRPMENELDVLSRCCCRNIGQRFRSLKYLLIAFPPIPDVSRGADECLRFLTPCLTRLKGLTLQAPRSSRQAWSDSALEAVIGQCWALRSLHVSNMVSHVSRDRLHKSLPYL